MSQAEDAAGTIERLLAIKTLPVLAEVHPDELAVIAEHARFATFHRGETLFSGSQTPVTSVHLVLEGAVVEYRGGRRFRVHGPQHVLGGVDALARSSTDVVAVAQEDTRTLAIERADLRDVLEDNFGILSAILQGVAASTLRLRRRLLPCAGFAATPSASDDDRSSLQDLGERIAFLQGHTWFRQARIRTLGQIAREADLRTLRDGERLWAQGEAAEYAVVVARGRIACATDDGRQRFEVCRGAIVGMEEALAMEARWCGAVTRDAVSLLRITRSAMSDVLEDDPDTALEALAAFAAVSSELRDRVAREIGEEV